jgi:NADP-reducing hydrogenase subunit HndD
MGLTPSALEHPTGSARDTRLAGHHVPPKGPGAETVAQPVKIDNDLYVRDYSRCILCYKCVEACGVEAQNTFAIAVAGRGFDARISTEFAVPLTHSACV